METSARAHLFLVMVQNRAADLLFWARMQILDRQEQQTCHGDPPPKGVRQRGTGPFLWVVGDVLAPKGLFGSKQLVRGPMATLMGPRRLP